MTKPEKLCILSHMHTLHNLHKTISPNTLFFKYGLALVLLLGVLIPPDALSGEGKSQGLTWRKIQTHHTRILFQSPEDLTVLNSRIDFPVPAGKDKPADTVETVSLKIDALFRRSRELLGMHGFVNKINIRIYPNREQLDRAFFEIYGTESAARAWYTHERLTVYVQLDDLHEGILAHELAHAVIDHYLMIPPPPETAEILARYVDTNLKGTRGTLARHESRPTHSRKSPARGYTPDPSKF